MKPYYDADGITIYNGDCREIHTWEYADVLATDPPYGIAYASGHATEVRDDGVYAHGSEASIDGDLDVSLRDAVLAVWGTTKPALVFGSLRAPLPAGWKQALCWDKGDAAGMGDLRIPWKPNWEPVFVLGDWPGGAHRGSGVIRGDNISRVSMGRTHPHEKPVMVWRQLLERCPSGVIADPFMGSGSCALAARDLGRRYVGIEIEERYCETAAKRLAQRVLFGGSQ